MRFLKTAIWVLLLSALCVWAYDISVLREMIRPLTFQVRDMARALELLKGNLIFFGPEMTGGGHLPGPLYYYIMALSFNDQFLWLVGQSVAAAVLGFLFLRRRFAFETAGLWLLCFLLSSLLEIMLVIFINPSYAILFQVLIFLCLLEAWTQTDERLRKKYFLLAWLLFGFALQLHASVLFFALALVILQVFAGSLKLVRFSWTTFALGLGVFALPLLPYLIWLLAGGTAGQAPFFAGSGKEAMPSLLAYVSGIPFARLAGGTMHLLLGMPLPFLAIAGVALCTRKGRDWPAPLKVALVCWLCALVPALYVFAAPIGQRYSGGYAVAGTFLTVFLFNEIRDEIHHKWLSIALAALTLIAGVVQVKSLDAGDARTFFSSTHFTLAVLGGGVLLYFALRSRAKWRGVALALSAVLLFLQNPSPLGGKLTGYRDVIPTNATWIQIERAVCEEHGWAFAEILQRFYFVGVHMESDLRTLQFSDALTCEGGKQDANAPDGYIATMSRYLEDGRGLQEFVLAQPIAQELREGLANGDVKLGEARGFQNLTLAPYYVVNKERMPAAFHNLGQGYVEKSGRSLLDTYGIAGETVPLPTAGYYLMMWNECTEQNKYCNTGAMLNLVGKGSASTIELTVLGYSLSQSSPWIAPEWNPSWQDPYLEVKCAGKTLNFPVAKSIGYDRAYSMKYPGYDFYLANHSMLAPYRRVFKPGCQPTEITVGRRATRVDLIRSTYDLPETRISFTPPASSL